MATMTLRLTGTRALLMHADVYVDQLNPLTKAHKVLTSKTKKSEEDHELIARSDWRGGLYFDDELGPYIPGANVAKCILEAARMSRAGKNIERGLELIDEQCRLEYDGPRTVDGLWNAKFYDARSVKNPGSKARVMRYRPKFMKWSIVCEVLFDTEQLDHDQVLAFATTAGLYCGLCDYRPKFGRFTVEVL